MPGPYIDLTTFKGKVSDLLQKQDVSLLKMKDSALQDSINAAYERLINILLGRQYSQAQIDAWDSRVSYNLDLALYWAFSRGAIPGTYSDTFVKTFERSGELKDGEFKLVIGGVTARPGSDDQSNAGATIGYGQIAQDVCIPSW